MNDSTGHVPARCEACGATASYRRRFVTGGGWRPVYVCTECGDRYTRRSGVVRLGTAHPRLVAGALAAVGAAVVWLRRRLRR